MRRKNVSDRRSKPSTTSGKTSNPAHVGDAKAVTFVTALGLCSRGVANKIRSEFSSLDFAGKVTSRALSKDQSIAQLTGWAENESVSLEDLERGIEVAMGCEACAHGGRKSGRKVKFAEKFAEAEAMSESERAKLMASVAEKRKAEKEKNRIAVQKRRAVSVDVCELPTV